MTAKPCEAFHWIGQPLDSCDVCGRPAWDHDRDMASGGTPFGGLVARPWPTATIAMFVEIGAIDEARAAELRAVTS